MDRGGSEGCAWRVGGESVCAFLLLHSERLDGASLPDLYFVEIGSEFHGFTKQARRRGAILSLHPHHNHHSLHRS